jgi:hypothetical protein
VQPYPVIGEDLYNASFDNHPAMLRYEKSLDRRAAGGCALGKARRSRRDKW